MKLDLSALSEVCVRNGIVRLRVFGSFARGEESEGSDLDLLADFASRKTLLDLVRIEREFSERLGVRVDLLTEPSLHPRLRDQILGDARVVYERAA